MPNDDDKSMDILSSDEISELFEDVIEIPDEDRFFIAAYTANLCRGSVSSQASSTAFGRSC